MFKQGQLTNGRKAGMHISIDTLQGYAVRLSDLAEKSGTMR